MRLYLMDSHRPIHHKNCNNDDRIIVIQDEACKSFDECPTTEDEKDLLSLAHIESSDDEYDSEIEHEEEAKAELAELKDDDADLAGEDDEIEQLYQE